MKNYIHNGSSADFEKAKSFYFLAQKGENCLNVRNVLFSTFSHRECKHKSEFLSLANKSKYLGTRRALSMCQLLLFVSFSDN